MAQEDGVPEVPPTFVTFQCTSTGVAANNSDGVPGAPTWIAPGACTDNAAPW